MFFLFSCENPRTFSVNDFLIEDKKHPTMLDSAIFIKVMEKDVKAMDIKADLRYYFEKKKKEDTAYFEFHNNVEVHFFNEDGNLSGVLNSDFARINLDSDVFVARKDVVIVNSKKEEFKTEEIFWFRDKREIKTDKEVYIKRGVEVIYGTGLKAKDDLSRYVITKIKGTFYLDE